MNKTSMFIEALAQVDSVFQCVKIKLGRFET